MIARRSLLALPLAAPALAQPAPAQPGPPRIGWLTAQREASLAPFIPALRAGLVERNLVDGRDIRLDFRFGDDDAARVPTLLDELLRLPVRVLLVQGAAVAPVIRARPPVPVVFVMSSDPVAAGLAESLSRAPQLEAAFAAIAQDGAQGLSVFADGFALQNRAAIARFAAGQRIPLVSGWRVFAEAGALLSYGPRLEDSYRRLAHFVARILRGASPEGMPIEQPRHFELVVNQRAAAAIGLDVPTALLARADLVIE